MRSDVNSELMVCPAVVYQAEGALSAQLKIHVDEAARVLRDQADAAGITVEEAARKVLTRYVRTEQGDLLDPWGSC